jgi:hypothetical protein
VRIVKPPHRGIDADYVARRYRKIILDIVTVLR